MEGGRFPQSCTPHYRPHTISDLEAFTNFRNHQGRPGQSFPRPNMGFIISWQFFYSVLEMNLSYWEPQNGTIQMCKLSSRADRDELLGYLSAFLTRRNKAQLGEVGEVHKDRVPAICHTTFPHSSHPHAHVHTHL